MKVFALALMVGLLGGGAAADVVHLANGGVVRGTVIQETNDFVTIAMQYGTTTVRRSDIASIEKSAAEEPESPADQTAKPSPDMRMPRWSKIVQQLGKAPWATGLTQIPATVIDKGVMRDVPYMSYRCGSGGNYEVNVYGDPDMPAGVEIGVYDALTKDIAAKRRCVDFVASVLPDSTDAALVKAARLDEDRIERGGLTVEVTPSTAPDAYAGWWISVYYAERLDRARASEEELSAITVGRTELETANSGKLGATAKTPPVRGPGEEPDTAWTGEDLRKARAPSVEPGTPSSGGRVYVRGYYRKNGTYVQPHTRSRPHR